jgi:hypothetical protein
MAAICCVALIGSGLYAPSVFAEHWADEQMQKYQDIGVINGYPDGSLGEDRVVTRAEAAKIFSELLARRDLQSAESFSDVPASHWARGHVQNVSALGIMNGTGDGLFEPEAQITREQAATVLNRVFAKFMAGTPANGFSDSAAVAPWAGEAVAALAGSGFIAGYPDGSFKPQTGLTRAELVTIIDKIVPNIVFSATDVKESYTGNVLVLAAGIDLSKAEISGNVAVAGAAVGEPPKLSESFSGALAIVEPAAAPQENYLATAETPTTDTPASNGQAGSGTGAGSGSGSGGGSPAVVPPSITVTFDPATDAYTAAGVNYLLFGVSGDYKQLSFSIGGNTIAASPVLTSKGTATLVKIAVPEGLAAGELLVKQGARTLISNKAFSFDAAGKAAPKTLYGEVPMGFSELYHDVTANSAEPGSVPQEPAATSFDAAGAVAAPKLFIAGGTRTGGAGGTQYPIYINGDEGLEKVDVVSSATYGDNPHFVPTGNMEINYEDPMTKGDDHAIVGVQKVQVMADFDLYANALLLEAAGKGTPQTAAVAAKMKGFELGYTEFADGTVADKSGAPAAAPGVYKAKSLLNDGNWGARVLVNEDAAKPLPDTIADPAVSYGVTWGDKVISFNFAPFETEGLDANKLWEDYFDYLYGGYVEDSEGHVEPLVFLQNMFTHRPHTNVEVAISPSRFSRLGNLKSPDAYKVTIFAYGFEDIEFSGINVAEYGNSEAAIEQGTAFDIKLGDESTYFEDGHLHIAGLEASYLDAYDPGQAKLLKGGSEVDAALYKVEKLEGEIELTFEDGFFAEGLQGSYTLKLQEDTPEVVSKAFTFTVNNVIARPGLKLPDGSTVPADTVDAAAEAAKGGAIEFDGTGAAAFARAITTAGRGAVSQIKDVTPGAEAVAEAIGGAISRADASAPYVIDLASDKFAAGHTYEISLVSANFKWAGDGAAANASFVYYIKIGE